MSDKSKFQEGLKSNSTLGRASERSFGIVFAVVFVAIGFWPHLGGGAIRLWGVLAGTGFLITAFVCPGVLKPFNTAWLAFGDVIQKIVSPVIMGVVFFLTVTPIGLIMRLFGKDVLSLRFDAKAKSYWINREPPGPSPDTMKNQF